MGNSRPNKGDQKGNKEEMSDAEERVFIIYFNFTDGESLFRKCTLYLKNAPINTNPKCTSC
jgi:hypothetical protein